MTSDLSADRERNPRGPEAGQRALARLPGAVDEYDPGVLQGLRYQGLRMPRDEMIQLNHGVDSAMICMINGHLAGTPVVTWPVYLWSLGRTECGELAARFVVNRPHRVVLSCQWRRRLTGGIRLVRCRCRVGIISPDAD